MKKTVSLLAMLFYCICSFGKSVSVHDAKTVGYHFMLQNGNAAPPNADALQLVYTAGDWQASFYIFNLAHGFVIVSAEDGVTPVLGYSNDNVFDINGIHENLSWLLNNFERQIAYVALNDIPASSVVMQQWQVLQANKATTQRTMHTTAVAPLLGTLAWNQDPGYNNLCPVDPSATCCGGHAPTGCVATAMAQVMYYWKWPDYPTGSNSYTSTNYGTISATFSGITYNWAAMPINTYNTNIETLMFDAGVAVNMDYGPTGSTAELCGSTASAAYALQNYFCYSSSIQGIQRAAFTDNDWISIIETELLQPRPVIYSGANGSGTGSVGHAWVVDGFNVNNFFHCNWGWGGTNNAYYYMNNMAPAASTTSFDSTQWVLIGITPNIPELVSMDSGEVCVGRNKTYIAGGSGGGTWSSSYPAVATVNTSGIVTGVAPGATTINYTASNSCGSRTTSGAVKVVSPTSSHNCDSISAIATVQSADNTFNIYPNPGNGNFTLELPQDGDATIVVFNLLGREVARQTSHSQTTELYLGKVIPAGMYIVELSMGNSIYRKIVVVQ